MPNDFDLVFKDHVIIKKIISPCEQIGYYFISKIDERNCSFRVTYSPETICFSGDAGCLVFENKPLRWLKNSCHSVSYLLEKAANQDFLREFSVTKAEEWLDEKENEINKEKQEIEDKEKETEENILLLEELEEKLALIEETKEWLEHDVHELTLQETNSEFLNMVSSLYDETPNLEELTANTRRMVAAVQCFVRLTLA